MSVKVHSRSRQRLLRVTADGADLLPADSGEKVWSFRWTELDEIVAFKVDAVTFDHMCLGFRRTGEATLLVADEDTPGWKELNDQLSRTFQISLDQWFSEVAFPAFAENRTTLWSRTAGSKFSSREVPPESPLAPIESFEVTFDGRVLRRGFWLYIVEIRHEQRVFAYVGRTGDSSSPNAGSLFTRMTTHLNSKPSAKGNSLFRHLLEQNLKWQECVYRFTGIGPLYQQQESMALHVPIRDEMAGLERAVADVLKEMGYVVLGSHPKRRPVAPQLLTAVLLEVRRRFPGAA